MQRIDAFAAQLKTIVQAAAETSESFDYAERAVRDRMRKMGQQAIDLFIQLQGDGDLGETAPTQDGKTLHRSESAHQTTIPSSFGSHHFEQFAYAPGVKKAIELRPLSARLSLPKRKWSFLLQEHSQMLAVVQAYEQAMNNLGEILGGNFSVDTAEKINAELGTAAGDYLNRLPDPLSESEAKLLVAQADCKGVPLARKAYGKR